MDKEKLTERIEIRVSIKEKNTLKMLADLYSEGNISAFIIDRALYSNRRVVRYNNFELSNRRVKKGDENKPAPSQTKEGMTN